ncbi:hypothetical protein PQ610_06470 [Tardisphaera miroshnichenkoae]
MLAGAEAAGPKSNSPDFRGSAAAALVRIALVRMPAWDSLANKIGLRACQKIRMRGGMQALVL